MQTAAAAVPIAGETPFVSHSLRGWRYEMRTATTGSLLSAAWRVILSPIAMLQAHSLLWHYLWVAPNVLLLILAILTWRRGLQKQFPIFLIFAFVVAIEQLVVYIADIVPAVSPITWWRIFWIGLLTEGLLKFALIGEMFGLVFGLYSSIAKVGKLLISGVGVVLVALAAVVAAYTPKDNIYWIVSGGHVLEQTVYIVECG